MAQRVSSPRFVGRAGELAVLDAALERAATGSPAFVFVAGESGVGKSRLVAELERRAQDAGARVLLGHCLELGGAAIPYAPLVAALRPIARDAAGAQLAAALTPATRAALTELLPDLAPHDDGRRSSEHAAQGRVFEALIGLLERLAAEDPLVLVLEDLHWADPSTRDFLTYLVRSARAVRLLVAVTYRSDELHRRHPLRPLLAELERTPNVERVALSRFTEVEAAEQLAGILEAAPEPTLLARVFGRSQGNPLYTEELLAASADGWELPASLADALLMRVERLTPAAQEVVRVAAVADRPVAHALLEAVSALPAGELVAGARDAIAHQILVLDRDGHYAFRHALVAEAVYGDLLPGERAALHGAIAAAIGERPELLGDDATPLVVAVEQSCHFASAHDQPRALEAAVRAGLAASRASAHSEALRQFDQALALWPRVPGAEALTGVDHPAILLAASTEADYAGDVPRGVGYAREAAAELEGGPPERLAAALERLGHALHRNGDDGEAVGIWDRGLALLPTDRPTLERVRLLEMRGRNLMLRGRNSEAVALAEEACAGARALGETLAEARALCTLGPSLAPLGRVDEGLAALRRARELAARCGAINEEARVLTNLTDVLDQAGRTREAQRVVDDGIAGLRERAAEPSSYDEFLALNGVWHAIRLGHFADAERRLPERPSAEEGITFVYDAVARAELAFRRGDAAAARAELARADGTPVARTEPQFAAPVQGLRAELALDAGSVEEARAAVAEGVAATAAAEPFVRLSPLFWLGARVEAEAAARSRLPGAPVTDVRRAEGYAARGLAFADALRPFPESRALALLAAGEARRAAGSDPATPFLDAAAAFAAIDLAWWAAYARLRAAEALAARGDRRPAGEALRAAHAWASAAGARGLADEARLLARRARLELEDGETPAAPESAAHDGLGLTAREIEVLRLVADGRTNREIGAALYMSDKTASVHVSRILAKLGVRSRVEAAGVAHRLGLGAREPAG